MTPLSRLSLVLLLCVLTGAVQLVSAATWYDDFSTDTSASYGGDVASFDWDSGFLNSSFGSKQIWYSTPVGYGRYAIIINGTYQDGENLRINILFHSGNMDTENWWSNGNKYGVSFRYEYDLIYLQKMVAGAYSVLDIESYSLTINTPYLLEIYTTDTGFKVYVDGNLIFDNGDTSFSSGYVGIGSDDDGNDHFLLDNFTINESASAAFTCTPTSGTAPLTTTCTQTGENHDDPGVTYGWSWSDGTANSTTEDPTHQYADPGTYDVTLCVSNVAGEDCHTESGYITVRGPPAIPPPIPIPLFCTLVFMTFGLGMYAFVDSHNKMYFNVIASAISVILAVYLAMIVVSGNVGTLVEVVDAKSTLETATNYTLNTTSQVSTVFTSKVESIYYTDGALSWFLIAVAGAMFLVTVASIKDAYEGAVEERKKEDEEEEY